MMPCKSGGRLTWHRYDEKYMQCWLCREKISYQMWLKILAKSAHPGLGLNAMYHLMAMLQGLEGA